MPPKKIIQLILILTLVPIGLVSIAIVSLAFNLPIPASPDWLYKYQSGTRKGDRLIGGGYFFAADGRDLWMRYRVLQKDNSAYISKDCNTQQLTTISHWFLDNAVGHQRWLWVVPVPNNYAEDRRILGDLRNLQCSYSGDMRHKYGRVPPDCNHWSLYHPPTQYYYHRYACYN